tara:strand:- start:427 stop:708 length:282 start_codon:yes stop_codon:yes gene_type:complete
MTKDDIIRMAIEAGGSEVEEADPQCFIGMMAFDVQELERFATLVAAAKREDFLKMIEPIEEHRRDASWGFLGGEEGVQLLDAIAAEIRASSVL